MKWRTIETAPPADLVNTHPVRCLVYGPRLGVQFGQVWTHPTGEKMGQAYGFTGTWVITHWMPLPSPPQT